jgi:hypothetical protein
MCALTSSLVTKILAPHKLLIHLEVVVGLRRKEAIWLVARVKYERVKL